MKKPVILILFILLMLAGCNTKEGYHDTEGNAEAAAESGGKETTDMEQYLHLYINDIEVPVSWEDNDSVDELAELAVEPLTIQMSMYGGFEQVGSLGTSIVRYDVQMTTAFGDIVLYSGNNIVLFYGSNSWAYTKLGHIDLSQKELEDLLGHGDVTISLSR